MIKILVTILLLATSSCLFARGKSWISYYNISNYAEYLVFKNEFKLADKQYKTAFKFVNVPKTKELIYSIICSAELKQFRCFSKRINMIRVDELEFAIYHLKNNQTIAKYLAGNDGARNLINALSQNVDSTLLQKINKDKQLKYDLFKNFIDSDQIINNFQRNASNCNSDSCKKLIDFTLNFYLRYIKTIEDNGYPNSESAGTNYCTILNLHLGDKLLFPYFKNIILREFNNGNARPSDFMASFDRFNYQLGTCGLNDIYTSNFCNLKKDWRKVVDESLMIGKSIFLLGNERIPYKNLKETALMMYLNQEFIKTNYGYSIFN